MTGGSRHLGGHSDSGNLNLGLAGGWSSLGGVGGWAKKVNELWVGGILFWWGGWRVFGRWEAGGWRRKERLGRDASNFSRSSVRRLGWSVELLGAATSRGGGGRQPL